MKYVLGGGILFLVCMFFLLRTDIRINHLFHSIVYQPKGLKEKTILKDLTNSGKLEGEFIFSCRHSPEIYGLYLGFKKSWHPQVDSFKLGVKVQIKDSTEKLIYSEYKEHIVGTWFPFDELLLADFNMYDCKKHTIIIDSFESDVSFPMNETYLYISVNTNK